MSVKFPKLYQSKMTDPPSMANECNISASTTICIPNGVISLVFRSEIECTLKMFSSEPDAKVTQPSGTQ